jgi:hypothetical protein
MSFAFTSSPGTSVIAWACDALPIFSRLRSEAGPAPEAVRPKRRRQAATDALGARAQHGQWWLSG